MISWNTHIQDDTHRDRMISQLWCQGRATKVLENRKNRKRILEAAEIPTQQSNWLLGDWVWLRTDRFDFMNSEKMWRWWGHFKQKTIYRLMWHRGVISRHIGYLRVGWGKKHFTVLIIAKIRVIGEKMMTINSSELVGWRKYRGSCYWVTLLPETARGSKTICIKHDSNYPILCNWPPFQLWISHVLQQLANFYKQCACNYTAITSVETGQLGWLGDAQEYWTGWEVHRVSWDGIPRIQLGSTKMH